MKFLLPFLPPLLLVSCQTTPIRQEPLPPLVRSSAVDYSEGDSMTSLPDSSRDDIDENEIRPLTPDPVNTMPEKKVPRYNVPENVQPKVPDGINQGEFIELKW
jgi:hypothetical protein